ncbi:MAG: hypothetical protein AAF847_10300 [Bacteroidota bacterium]
MIDIDQFKNMMREASETLKTQMNTVGSNAKDRAYKLIEEWLVAIPVLEQEGLEMTSFALSVAISPALEVEFKGKTSLFTLDRLDQLKRKYKSKVPLQVVFTTIKTTYRMHQSINAPMKEPLIVKIKVKLTPEVSVFIGEPIIM